MYNIHYTLCRPRQKTRGVSGKGGGYDVTPPPYPAFSNAPLDPTVDSPDWIVYVRTSVHDPKTYSLVRKNLK